MLYLFQKVRRTREKSVDDVYLPEFTLHSSDIMSLHRYCRDRFIDFVPGIDVDGNVRVEDLMSLVPVVQKHLACFDNAK